LADDWASFDLSCGDFCFEVYWGDFWRRIKNEESFRVHLNFLIFISDC
jgi:hypothetical protein